MAPPLALAMVLCDAVVTDPWTDKKSALGIYGVVWVPSLPMAMPTIFIYGAITEAAGFVSIMIRVIDADEERASLAQWNNDFEVTDPLQVIEFVAELHEVTIPTAGEYRIQLFAGTEFVAERKLTVIESISGSTEE